MVITLSKIGFDYFIVCVKENSILSTTFVGCIEATLQFPTADSKYEIS
jgi:hypothetical protein